MIGTDQPPEPTAIISPGASITSNTGMLTPERIDSPVRSTYTVYSNASLQNTELLAEPNTTTDIADNDVDMERDTSPQEQRDDAMDIVQDEELPIHAPVTNEEDIPTVQDREQSVTGDIEENIPTVDEAGEPELTNIEMDGFQAMADVDMYDPNDNNFDSDFEQEQTQTQPQTHEHEQGQAHTQEHDHEQERTQEHDQVHGHEQEDEQEDEQELIQEDEEDENGITEAQILAEMEEMGALFKKTKKYTRLSRLGFLHIEALEKTCYGPMRETRNSTQDPLVRSAIEDFYSRLMSTFNEYDVEYQAYVEASAAVHYMDLLSKQMTKDHLTAVADTMEVEKEIVETNKQIELLQSKIETSKTIENYLFTVRALVQPSSDDVE
ncbi:hypothetical protein HPULCUR_007441 [Helicostylum pulchrum]|uniref:Uncharacterized protein n=1 Tax=Helicostylum pulchrum TaxID=562976 RepID=A0ABP9Y4R8_9FUNG